MSTYLEIMGELRLQDAPELWLILARLEKELANDLACSGLKIDITGDNCIVATFDFAGECGGISGTAIENDLARLSDYTLQATCLMIGWDNIRERQFFGPAEEVTALKSRLALDEIIRLREALLAEDRLRAADILLSVSR